MSQTDELVEQLRAAGYRLTPQRLSVLLALCNNEGHLTAEQVLTQVREHYPYLNKSAVYRSLDLLSELGLITQTDLGQGRVEYELHRHPHHHHLVCRGCGGVARVDHALFRPLDKALQESYGFSADLDHFAIFGRCRRCRKRTE